MTKGCKRGEVSVGGKCMPKVEKEFEIGKGLVYGNYWGGGQSGFASRYSGKVFKSRPALVKFLDKELKIGSLDSGMGYESLIGYCVDVIERKKANIGDETFINEDHGLECGGKLTDEEADFLIENMYY